jgi:hypothetical protein
VARGIQVVEEMISLDVTRSPNGASLEQMKKLDALWTSRFFNKDILALPSVLQISEFSL